MTKKVEAKLEQKSNTASARAEYLLRVVAQFINENPLSQEFAITYDDAECDGGCLAGDCLVAAEELYELGGDGDEG